MARYEDDAVITTRHNDQSTRSLRRAMRIARRQTIGLGEDIDHMGMLSNKGIGNVGSGFTGLLRPIKKVNMMMLHMFMLISNIALLGLPFFLWARAGTKFNSVMETANLGIASLIAGQADLLDSTGKVTKGTKAFAIAQGIAAGQVRKLRIAGLETAATTQQLVEAYQQALGPGLQAKLALDQIREITVLSVQAAAAMGLPMTQLNEEVRSLLSGTITFNSRIAKTLGISSALVKTWKRKGELADELVKRLEIYRIAGVEVAKTWTGALSNFQEAFEVVAGASTEGFFEEMKKGFLEATEGIIDIKQLKIAEELAPALEGISYFFTSIGKLIREALTSFIGWMRTSGEEIKQFVGYLRTMYKAFGNITRGIWALLTPFGMLMGDVDYLRIFFLGFYASTVMLSDGLKILGGSFAKLFRMMAEFAVAKGILSDELTESMTALIPKFQKMEEEARKILESTIDYKQYFKDMVQDFDNLVGGVHGFSLATEEALDGTAIPKTKTWLELFKTGFHEAIKKLPQTMQEIFTEMGKVVGDGVAKWESDVGAAFGKMIFEGKNFGQSMQQMWTQLGITAVQELIKIGLRMLWIKAIAGMGGISSQSGVFAGTEVNNVTAGSMYIGPASHTGTSYVNRAGPAVLQTGERVLSATENAQMRKEGEVTRTSPQINLTIQAVDAQSFTNLLANNEQAFAALLQKQLLENPGFRNMISSV